MISWRRFIVTISTPFPVPTSQDIVDAVHKLKEAAPLGLIGKTKFMEVRMYNPSYMFVCMYSTCVHTAHTYLYTRAYKDAVHSYDLLTISAYYM